ncbi:FecR family protein [Caulobacter hibisci]|uniref:FecR domain-containing protein n=1 Tax=Caulobacter hibisci TaxID=2035993 RepID=A0ABS0SRL3_9CAUL|nr:FecR domain-containing protein [Caulobacter hibisci]MBI1682189.1 FecR domain-containing protein [Caulobacter hibisci]
MSTRSVNARDDREAALWADARREAGWSPRQQATLEQWLEGRPDRHDLLRRHEALIDDAAVIWATQRMARTRTTPRRWQAWTVGATASAGFAVILGAVVMVGGVMPPRGDLIVGARGVPKPIALADGSAIRLNGQSQVRVELGQRERRLHLKGEGFFEVAPDKSRPFSVEVDGVRVTAVGTRFNVDQRQTPAGAVVEVEVFEGVVKVTGRGPSVNVRAGERAWVSGGVVRHAALARPERETDVPPWAKGWLEFNEATLGSVVEDLERATGVEVTLADPAVGRVLVSGRFAYDDPENALAAMARLHGFKLTRQGPDQFEISGG